MQTGNFQLVREINRRLVFDLIRESGEISRAAIGQLTRLSKATVSAVVEELIDTGLVSEGDVARGAVGRRPILLAVNPNGPLFAGVQAGPDRIIGALVDPKGTIAETTEEEPNGGGQSTIRALAEVLTRLKAAAARSGRSIRGAGIGIPGILNPSGDVVLSAPRLDWRNVSLRRVLEALVDFPIWLGDEAKLAALAEATVGAGKGTEVLLYLGFDTTVGGGVVRRGRLDGGMLAGHLTVVPDGPPCWCGNSGCLEALVGEERLRQKAAGLFGEDHATLDRLIEEADARPGGARDMLVEAGRWAGIAAANLVHLYQPELVLLGGRLSGSATFVAAAREEIGRRVLAPIARPVRIDRAALGSDAVLAGAAMVALEGSLSPVLS